MRARRFPVFRSLFAGAALAAVAGCAGIAASREDEAERVAGVLENLAESEWDPAETISRYPLVDVRTKISGERITARPLVQADGRSFSAFAGAAIGYPASLRVTNRDQGAAEIAVLEIFRRPEGSFGSYEPFVGNEPIVLQSGESWEGTFIVSRKEGWYRIRVRPTAPEGWDPLHGEALRNVFFRTGATEDRLQTLVFWNMGDGEVAFRYWVARGVPKGIPDDFTASGSVSLAPGATEIIPAEIPRGDWALVAEPGG